ncbi:hypothetical protein [Paraburkholderia pallida]|uniref:Uncharacterized protein n=1 Tax=Paraburkholderia pallida TaxID=2547399 RepID=A0A4P7D6G9_9BURK|nr:hypothetical protein [Paraburkholderia pallida]QBR04309.1 hypothetical protein E1956_45195 [Paraburkholderia pallida]
MVKHSYLKASLALSSILLLLASQAAHAGDPNSFLGLKLGAPLEARTCDQPHAEGTFCLKDPDGPAALKNPGHSNVELSGGPDLDLSYYRTSVDLIDGKIESIMLSSDFDTAEKLKNALTIKFGPPTSTDNLGFPVWDSKNIHVSMGVGRLETVVIVDYKPLKMRAASKTANGM